MYCKGSFLFHISNFLSRIKDRYYKIKHKRLLRKNKMILKIFCKMWKKVHGQIKNILL